MHATSTDPEFQTAGHIVDTPRNWSRRTFLRPDPGLDPGLRENRLVAEFREIVQEPLPDLTDPRFKNWNVAERFPW